MQVKVKKEVIIVAVAASVFAIILFWWLLSDQPLRLGERIPGMDDRPKAEAKSDSVIIGQFFDTLGTMDEVIP